MCVWPIAPRLLDDLMGACGQFASFLMRVLWRVHEDKASQAHVHHASGNCADVGRRFCINEHNADVVEKDGALLVVTSTGFGKQTPLKEYSAKGRATGGISTIDQKALKEIGNIVAARVVQQDDDLTIITANGVAIRIKNKTVKQAGRSTKGVHLIKPQDGDYVASVARISAEDLKRAGAQIREEEKVEPQPQLIYRKK